jgi:hypothetical protein
VNASDLAVSPRECPKYWKICSWIGGFRPGQYIGHADCDFSRQSNLDCQSACSLLNHGPLAKYFEHLAHEGTEKAKSILGEADEIADELGLDDGLLDELIGLKL